MKNYFKILPAGLILIAMSACKTLVDRPAAIPDSDRAGTITVITTGTGAGLRGERRAIIDGERQAFKELFFRGYPDSQQKIPMIGVNEIALMQQHKAYFDQFFGMTELGPNRYRTFVISSRRVKKSGNILTMEVKINLRALRADLEQHGVIRRFGY